METLAASLVQRLIEVAEAGGPDEVCGFVDSAEVVHPILNVASNPDQYFTMAVPDILDLYDEVGAQDGKIVAVYHTHPAGPVKWSERDRQYWVPNLLNVLVARGVNGWEIVVKSPGSAADSGVYRGTGPVV